MIRRHVAHAAFGAAFVFVGATSAARIAAAQNAPAKAAPAKAAAAAAETRQPRYLGTIREELTKMGIQATCNADSATRGRCKYTLDSTRAARRFEVYVEYSDDSDTVYHYVDRYLELTQTDARSPELLARLMSLNWQMLIGKLELHAETGEVRLSAVENTDSNFDRRAFRSTVRALHNLAERHYGELTALVSRE